MAGDNARVVAVKTFGDEVLSAIAPIGMAMAAGTALVVDLDPEGPAYPGERTVLELALEGPRRSELAPDRSGVAVLRNGGAEPAAALEVVATLSLTWPAIVVRMAADPVPYPLIPVRALLPGFLAPTGNRPSVWQKVPGGGPPPGPGPLLPRPGRSVVAALLAGRRPLRSRWVKAWATVWELPWQ